MIDLSMDSKVILALALLLLEHKPNNISVRDYVCTLRSCARYGKRPPDKKPDTDEDDELRHLSGVEYWKQRFDENATKLMELQVQIRELDEEKRLLKIQADSAMDKANEMLKQKKKKQIGPEAIVQEDDRMRSWTACKAVYEPISPASSTLLGQLHILHLTDNSEAIAEAFGNVCETLLLTIEELCTNPHTSLMCPNKSISLSPSSQNESICKAIDLVFRRLLASLSDFDSSTARTEHRTAVRSAFVSLLVGTVDAIHLNSRALLSICTDEEERLKMRDLRAGLTSTLVSFISSLQYSSRLERETLEAATYAVLEAAGRCLCQQSQTDAKASKQSDTLSKPAALKATSAFVLDLLKCVLQRYKSHANNSASALNQQALIRFHEAVMFGVFGSKREAEVPVFGHDDDLDVGNTTTAAVGELENYGNDEEANNILQATIGKGKPWGGIESEDDFILVDNSFADEVWSLVGLDAFMMTL